MHEIFDHTADLGLRIRAPSLEELLIDAARGLFSVMVADLATVRPVEEAAFRIDGENVEELLHDWLAELLFTFHVRRLVLAEFRVRVDAAGMTATARGEPIDPARHAIEVEVKAVTWHGLKVERRPDGWFAEVIVDI